MEQECVDTHCGADPQQNCASGGVEVACDGPGCCMWFLYAVYIILYVITGMLAIFLCVNSSQAVLISQPAQHDRPHAPGRSSRAVWCSLC